MILLMTYNKYILQIFAIETQGPDMVGHTRSHRTS